MDLNFWLASGSDFVLSLRVAATLITPVMGIDWIGNFLEVDFDTPSFEVREDLIGFTKDDLFRTLLKDCFIGKLRNNQ